MKQVTDPAILSQLNGGRVAPGNINLHNRPRVQNGDKISTVRSASFNFDGKEVLLPTVSDDGRLLSNDEAVALYKQTGKHLGIFDTPQAATAYAQQLHLDQEREYAPRRPVTDPNILLQLNGGFESVRQPAQPAAPEESLPSAAANFVKGIYGGLHRIPQSGVELIARGTDAVGISDGAYPMFHEMFTKDNASFQGGSKYAKGGDIVGQIGGTLPVAALRIPGLAGRAGLLGNAGRVVEGAGQGAAAAALTSSASDAPLGEQLGLGAALGGALPLAGAAINSIKSVVPNALSVSTGAGANSIRQAFQAGREGGDASKAFTASMRGEVPMEQVVEQAKSALGRMRAEKSAAYRSGMADISQDKTVLDFSDIDKALSGVSTVKNFKGQDLSKSTAGVRQEIAETIDNWKTLDPAEFHTPEGMDALKQQLKDILDSQDPTKPAYVVAKGAYDAVRNTIAKQAPAYDKVMQDYAKASQLVDDLQRELSLGSKGNPNTALRKLQSVMRDNVNTSWGKRADYANVLSESGAPTLIPSLAGQALSSPLPRGLARYGDMGLATAAAMTNPTSLAALPLASPRVVGELAHGAGQVSRGATGLFGSAMPALPDLRYVNPLLGGSAGGALAYQ